MRDNEVRSSGYCIAASLLAADLACLGREVDAVLKAGVDSIHLDVMDNHYVPNLTFGPSTCQALRRYGVKAPIDVHLMIQPIDALIPVFIAAGATSITFHADACKDVKRTLDLIHEGGCDAGLAFSPALPLTISHEVVDKLDSILIMSVNPGFGGQRFMPVALEKIKQAAFLAKETAHTIRVAVDGGVTLENLGAIVEAGADTAVLGTTLFSSKNYQVTLKQCRNLLSSR